ncbi:amidase [Paracoccus aminophilus]|uniref:Aspartyl-tRNA(Asn)/glutamyl-tRNA (Gln) amidotransferase subunit A n=1 Tax=Paracoccus aminophilus JCM 7686 TaxID=1367847 RepID=S5YZL4_PARAH|nr:amidase [Paracoccus aminophilus]AGT10651.1 aspartyl-tRNA(Asn)/glutamyl-tRNA (Gln) amidotransferase subunit A [Paracoccus aminophilus JCM 7686]
MTKPAQPLTDIAEALALGETTSRQLVETALALAARDRRAFSDLYAEAALVAADEADARRRNGAPKSKLDGIPVTVKDNMDLAGEVTRAGSKVLETQPAATRDATVVQRLRQTGAVILGRTFMPELALASIGTSLHHAAPPNALDNARVPGGSSSGAAISVGRGIVPAAVGTDTGGSVTLPAAVNGLVGYKPTARLLPRDGVVPLSRHLDTVGVISRSVSSCRLLAGAMSDRERADWLARPSLPVEELRFCVPTNYVLADLDPKVAEAFDLALSLLRQAGIQVEQITLPELDRIPQIYEGGGFAMPEIAAWLGRRGLLDREDDYDPRMMNRIREGAQISAVAMLDSLALREELVTSARQRLAGWDGMLMPTTPIVAPRFSEVQEDADYRRLNMRLMRNSRVANILDLCAVSLPIPAGDPTLGLGLLVAAPAWADPALLEACARIEAIFGQADPGEAAISALPARALCGSL